MSSEIQITPVAEANPSPVGPPPVSPYAVIRTGGKQYRVSAGSKIRVELVEAEKGSSVTFSDILLVGGTEAAPEIKAKGSHAPKAEVVGKVLGTIKNKKVLIFKKRRKGGYTKKQGHRQKLTEILIERVAVA